MKSGAKAKAVLTSLGNKFLEGWTRSLTEKDLDLLADYDQQTAEIASFASDCANGIINGMLLFGHGGTGKSYKIRETFNKMGLQAVGLEDLAPEPEYNDDGEEVESFGPANSYGFDSWVEHLGRITPKGLCEKMRDFPNSVHLVEDAETLLQDKNVWGILRSALHSQDHALHSKRRVTWVVSQKSKGSMAFDFRGSVIIIGNRILDDDSEEIKATKTRVPCLNFNVSNEALVAMMKRICTEGYKGIVEAPLTPAECFTVLEFILKLFDEGQYRADRLSLRVLMLGFRYLCANKMGFRDIRWQDKIHSQLKEEVGARKRTRAERIHDEKQAALEVANKKWKSQETKLVEYCKSVGRDITWASQPKDSEAYKKGFNAAKGDFQRKVK